MTQKLTALLTLLACTSIAQVTATFGFGKCLTPQLKTNFSRDLYVGRWYEQSRDSGLPLEWGQSCGTETYYKRSDGNIQVHFDSYPYTLKWPKLALNSPIVCNFTAGTCYQDAFHDPPQAEGKAPNYLLVDTDYDSYSIVYSCFQLSSSLKYELLWLMSRVPEIEDKDYAKMFQIAKDRLPGTLTANQAMVYQSKDKCEYTKTMNETSNSFLF